MAHADSAIRLAPDYAKPYLTLGTGVGGLRGYLARGAPPGGEDRTGPGPSGR